MPSFISRRMAVGAEYQTVTRRLSMNSYHRSALKPESSTTWVVPFDHGPMMPYEVPGDPAWIGVAPVDVIGLQIQNPLGCEVLRNDRVVNVLRAFGLTGGAGSVMQNGGRLSRRRIDGEVFHSRQILHVELYFALLESESP